MKAEIKQLYGGAEDQHGRFQWQSELPTDIGEPALGADGDEFAIVVRHARCYGDPQKVLAINSIAIQSPLLREMLDEVLADYPGIMAGLKKMEFSGRFESIIHRWPAFRAKIADLQKQAEDSANVDQTDLSTRIEHATLLNDLLVKEFTEVHEAMQDMKDQGVTTFEHLWTIFEPGVIVYAKSDNQDRAFRLQSSKYGKDREGQACFWLSCVYVDYDGQRFGVQKMNIQIDDFAGTMPIVTLNAYPMIYHADKDNMQLKLITRGGKVEALAGTHFRAYNGVGWRHDGHGGKEKTAVHGRIVVDTLGFNRFNPDQAVYLTSIDSPKTTIRKIVTAKAPDFTATSFDPMKSFNPTSFRFMPRNNDDGGMPTDGFFDNDLKDTKRPPLADDQKLICSPLVRGYALREKQWLNLFVNSVSEISFSENAFEALTLPKNEKSLVLAICDSKNTYRSQFDDVIEGKGRGSIILLYGPPGVGKTLTAESVAEQMKVPLFVMAAGDLGIDSRTVENKLQTCLDMCARWNAILLIDEADIFLEQRSMHELERNKLVSIFLRLLEYYEGIMFLTTNRVETFDAAFVSRIHISLQYSGLDYKSRKGVWQNFLKQHNAAQQAFRDTPARPLPGAATISAAKGDSSAVNSATETELRKAGELHEKLSQPHTVGEAELCKLAQLELNGREIKNFLKTAQLLANHREEPLAYEHVDTVVSTMAHLHKASKASEEAKGAIFN